MKQNIGMIDRAIRLLIGAVLIAFAIPIGFPSLGWNWIGWIGLGLIGSALIGTCPLYALLGLSACPRKS